MTSVELVKRALKHTRLTTTMMLEGLSDEEILLPPVPGANSIAWQLGHTIVGENYFMNLVTGGKMPPLPEGFAKQHDKKNPNTSPAGFLTKSAYLALWEEQRQATLRFLGELTEEDLDRPSPESAREHFPKVGDMLIMCAIHESWHQGQFALTRRKLGKPHAF